MAIGGIIPALYGEREYGVLFWAIRLLGAPLNDLRYSSSCALFDRRLSLFPEQGADSVWIGDSLTVARG